MIPALALAMALPVVRVVVLDRTPQVVWAVRVTSVDILPLKVSVVATLVRRTKAARVVAEHPSKAKIILMVLAVMAAMDFYRTVGALAAMAHLVVAAAVEGVLEPVALVD